MNSSELLTGLIFLIVAIIVIYILNKKNLHKKNKKLYEFIAACMFLIGFFSLFIIGMGLSDHEPDLFKLAVGKALVVAKENNNSSLDTPTIPIKGKVVLWSTISSEQYSPNSEVYSENVENVKNSPLTIFFIMNQIKESTGKKYSWSNEKQKLGGEGPGYRFITDIIVVYWPELKFAGKHTVIGAEPAQDDFDSYEDRNGKYVVGNDMIQEWIDALPRQS